MSLRFYSLTPGLKLIWYKSSHYRAKSPFNVQILKLLTMWFKHSYIFRPLNSCHFLPHPHFTPPLPCFPQFFSWVQTLICIMMASQSTCSPEAQHHQSALKRSTAAFIKLMKDEDEHNMRHYGSYIADIKFLLDTHIADFATRTPKDVEKQIIEMVKDLSCKYLHPQESKTQSSDEDFPESFTRPVNEQIFSDFPKGTLTDEMNMHIENAIEFMEQSCTAAANALKELKKTTPVIPHDPFRLLLQALCQLVIKL